ncbi:MAG: hypothetical protein WCO12_03590 [bacterium]
MSNKEEEIDSEPEEVCADHVRVCYIEERLEVERICELRSGFSIIDVSGCHCKPIERPRVGSRLRIDSEYHGWESVDHEGVPIEFGDEPHALAMVMCM